MKNKSLYTAIFERYHQALANNAPDQAKQCKQLSPTGAMFVLAIDGMKNSPMAGLTEESLTANFAGRLAAQYTWAVECIGNKSEKPALWGEYSKNGQNYDSESQRGADFALVVPVNKNIVKIAIFQAKKARIGQADISQGGSATAPDAQLEKLFDTAKTTSLAANISEEFWYTWVHYVFWSETGICPKSISLAKLESILVDRKKVDVSQPSFGSFADLLLSAMTEVGHMQGTPAVVDGWLVLGVTEATSFLPKLYALIDVIFADEEGEGGVFAEILNTASGNSLDQKIEPVDQKSVKAQEAATVQITNRPKKGF